MSRRKPIIVDEPDVKRALPVAAAQLQWPLSSSQESDSEDDMPPVCTWSLADVNSIFRIQFNADLYTSQSILHLPELKQMADELGPPSSSSNVHVSTMNEECAKGRTADALLVLIHGSCRTQLPYANVTYDSPRDVLLAGNTARVIQSLVDRVMHFEHKQLAASAVFMQRLWRRKVQRRLMKKRQMAVQPSKKIDTSHRRVATTAAATVVRARRRHT